jgi:SnoaL-like domain
MTMSFTFTLGGIAALLGLVAVIPSTASGPPASTPAGPDTDASLRAGVTATLTAYHDLAAAGDWQGVSRLYADDPRLRWWTNGVVVAHSFAELRRGLLSLPPGTRAENTFTDPEITRLGPGLALVATPFTTQISSTTGSTSTFGGFMTMVLVERDGGWRILNGHASSPMSHPPAAGQ